MAVASIHLPLAGTHTSSSALQSVDNSTCKLQFIVFRNGKLFPCTGNSSNLADDGKRRSVSTPVAFTKLGKRQSIFIIVDVMSTLKRTHACAQTLSNNALHDKTRASHLLLRRQILSEWLYLTLFQRSCTAAALRLKFPSPVTHGNSDAHSIMLRACCACIPESALSHTFPLGFTV